MDLRIPSGEVCPPQKKLYTKSNNENYFQPHIDTAVPMSSSTTADVNIVYGIPKCDRGIF